MRTIHLHAGTGLRVVRCKADELFDAYQESTFSINSFGCGRKNEESGNVRLVFDTRLIETLDLDNDLSFDLGPDIKLIVHHVSDPVGVALIVDLGNTRSFGLLLDDINHPKDMQIYPLEIKDYSGETDAFTKSGVFASHVCLEAIAPFEHPCFPKEKAHYGRPLSPIRTGEVARSLMLQVAGFDQQPNGRFAQVSPKRFFWDNDPARFNWKSVCTEEQTCFKPHGILYDRWLTARSIAPENMPRATLIGAMVVELYSQGEMQLNGKLAGAGQSAVGPRRIRHVAITFPPAWTMKEKEAYRETIRRHLDAFCEERGLRCPNLHVSCDEATGTLLAYISNEVEKFGGGLAEWVASIGSGDENGNSRARIAVLDVGGGTSDLVIADVCVIRGQYGMQDLQIIRLHQDGVIVAGDELLRKVVARIVLPAVAEALCPENPDTRKALFDYAVSNPTTDDTLRQQRSRWAQDLWFPMALRVMQTCQQNKNAELPGDITPALNRFCEDCLGIIVNDLKLDRLLFNLGVRDSANNGSIAKHFKVKVIPKHDLIAEICREVFVDAVQRFVMPMSLAGCDRLLLAGKTTEFKVVRDVLIAELPLPACKVVSFEEYILSARWVSSAGRNGTNILGDVKMTTVMGAALEFCNRHGIQAFGLAINRDLIQDAHHFSDSQQYWGIVPSGQAVPTFRNRYAVFIPGGGAQTAQIPMQTQSLLLARRRTALETMTAQIAYELRVRPELSAMPNGVVEIERVVNSEGSVELLLVQVVSGTLACANGSQEPLRTEHLELRMMVAQNDDFWMSDGNLKEEVRW